MAIIHSIGRDDERQEILFDYLGIGKPITIKVLKGFANVKANLIISHRFPYTRKIEVIVGEDKTRSDSHGVDSLFILASSVTVTRIGATDLKFTLEIAEREDVNADNSSSK